MERNDKGSFGMHPPPPDAPPKAKPLHIPSLVLSIIGLVFAFRTPHIIAIPCSIIAFILSRSYSQSHQTKAAHVISVIALVVIAFVWIALIIAFIGRSL